MARRKTGWVKVISDINRAATKMERLRVQEAAKKERELLRLQKAAEAERARIARQNERDEKAAALQRQRREAEAHKLRIQQASLEDQYAIVRARYHEISTRLPELADPETIIAYCNEGVRLVPMLFDYETRKSLLEKSPCVYPDVTDLYLRLSKAYETMGMYDRAILACRDAMEMGITSAGEQGSMADRIMILTNEKNEVKYNG
ncbi:MAG TPA: hypothetical protein IAD48_03985 [Candidatus Limiplasma pullistercoris]|nr:hypothetical protein [Candidatus Limiplasma pullistercoris]